MNKIVCMPIEVPKGIYCWKRDHQDYSKTILCTYFDNEGGHPQCLLNFYGLKATSRGVLKPKECEQLKQIK